MEYFCRKLPKRLEFFEFGDDKKFEDGAVSTKVGPRFQNFFQESWNLITRFGIPKEKKITILQM